VFYLVCEVATKLLWALLAELHVAEWIIAAIFAAVGVLALLLMTQTMKFSSAGPQVNCTVKARAALSLWQDPVLILVSGLNLSFGFSAAFMGGFVTGTFAKPQLGESAVPMLAAFSATFAAMFARCFGTLEVSIGKGPLVVLGSVSFLLIPLSFFVLGCCSGWDWWLLVLYVFQGIGRAVYESTSKGIFADLFPGQPVGAFSNAMLQTSLAFALCFLLSDILTGPVIAGVSMLLSVLTPIGYFAALWLRRRAKARAEEGANDDLGLKC